MANQTYLRVNRKELNQVELRNNPIAPLNNGEILLQVEKFALTANNITYAVIAPQLKYFDFFPEEQPFGIIPVWGFGIVRESMYPDIEVGSRYYGYFPMSTHLVVQPSHVKKFGFSDRAEHRKELSPIYNYYYSVENDLACQENEEDYLPIIRPLFLTAFLIYHHLKDQDFLGARQIIITSASSKTALGAAAMFKQNDDKLPIIGLTSFRNLDFVKSTGYYDEVLSYGEIDLIAKTKALMIDFAGNAILMSQVHRHLNQLLLQILQIGMTDWSANKDFQQLTMAKWFFAPDAAQKKNREWGVEKTNRLSAASMKKFIDDMKKRLEIVSIDGMDPLPALYQRFLKGNVDPSKGIIFCP